MISSYDHLAFHAAERPAGVALIVDGRAISYAEFRRDVATLSRALREFGLPPGSLVAVGCEDLYRHWSLLLAFERLGIVTASLSSGEGIECLPLLASSDLALLEPQFPAGDAKRHHALSAEWLRGALAGAEDTETHLAPFGTSQAPLRIVRTSGTTGASKRLLFTGRVHGLRVGNWIWCSGLTRRSRYLLTLPLKVAGAYIHATACIRVGATLVSESRTSPGDALVRHGITHVTLLPAWLRQALDDLPRGFEKPANLMVASFGATLPEALRQQARARLATEVVEFYGSNEVGFVSSTGSASASGLGTVWPGAKVQIVDERDRPMPEGALGQIRIKTDSMVDGYVGDPEATSHMFRSGWFYPGDTGRMPGRGYLHVMARDDELLNIGGGKISPVELEELILRQAGVQDVGVFSMPDSTGVEELWVAVSGVQVSDAELLERVTRALDRWTLGRFRVAKVPSIPRTATGKIQRHLLKSSARANA